MTQPNHPDYYPRRVLRGWPWRQGTIDVAGIPVVTKKSRAYIPAWWAADDSVQRCVREKRRQLAAKTVLEESARHCVEAADTTTTPLELDYLRSTGLITNFGASKVENASTIQVLHYDLGLSNRHTAQCLINLVQVFSF